MLSIAIASKNRWQALRETLTELAKRYPDLPIKMIDDGSDEPMPFEPSSLNANVEMRTETESRGYIVRRNELAQWATTPYVMSLDDDSFPVEGDLLAITRWMDQAPDVMCTSLPIFNPVVGAYQNAPRGESPSDCRAFIGCAHIMRRDAFLGLGGYNASLTHQGEEMDLAARGLRQGWRCAHYPSALVHHMESNEGRNWTRMDFHGARNAVWWNDWYVPEQQQAYRRTRRVLASMQHAVRNGRVGQLSGHWSAARTRSTMRSFQARLSPEQFQHWLSMPFA